MELNVDDDYKKNPQVNQLQIQKLFQNPSTEVDMTGGMPSRTLHIAPHENLHTISRRSVVKEYRIHKIKLKKWNMRPQCNSLLSQVRYKDPERKGDLPS